MIGNTRQISGSEIRFPDSDKRVMSDEGEVIGVGIPRQTFGNTMLFEVLVM